MTDNPEVDNFILGILSALIVALITALCTRIAKLTHEQRQHDQAEKKMMDAMALMVFRMAVYDEHFAIGEKLEAYVLYRSLGGNHQTKSYMDHVLGEDVDNYLEHHPDLSSI